VLCNDRVISGGKFRSMEIGGPLDENFLRGFVEAKMRKFSEIIR